VFERNPLADPAPLIRRVYAYVAYRVGDGPDAEDVTSDVFELATRYGDSYDPRKGEPTAWLLGIARRRVAFWFANRPAETAQSEEQEAPADVEREALDRLELRAALRGLDDRDQELLALRYGADLPAREIAELLGMKTNAVEVALHRALARLKTVLEEEERPAGPPAVADPAEDAV
jgi:RNA polymerase sigma-70 factor (ECF subfamily)